MSVSSTNQVVESLYIHWPFCPYRCHFCPFIALAGHDQYMKQYHDALKKEIMFFTQKAHARASIKTIFLGGGTPSTWPDDLLLDMFGILNKEFETNELQEVTIEVNPGTVRKEQLEIWKKAGINRLSIGVQSLNDSVLTNLNRHQKASDVFKLLDMARPLFDNLSIDLIIGLPGVSPDEWKKLINEVIQFDIKHISVYFLTVHEDTPLYFKVKKNLIDLPCDETIVDLYYWTIEKLATAGLRQYELSNFAKIGFESKHNQVYWRLTPFKAFGLGAFSFDGRTRTQNEKNLLQYLSKVENNLDTTIFAESLNFEQLWLEKLMLGLRQTKGVNILALMDGLSSEKIQKFNVNMTKLLEDNFLNLKDDYLTLSKKGLSVANEVTVQLSIF